MKKLLAIFILSSALTACQHIPTAQEATGYNNKLVNIQGKLIDKQTALNSTFGSADVEAADKETMEKALKDFMKEVKTGSEEINKVGAFFDDKAYMESTLAYFTAFKDLAENDYTQLVKYYTQEADWSEEDKVAKDKIFESISSKIDRCTLIYTAGYSAYCKKYGI